MLLHVSIILYIKIYRKWISFSFFIPHFRCICNPLNLLCTFAYFSICTTAKKMIRHYVSLNFRIVIQYHLSDYYVLSKIKYKSQKLLSNFQKTRKKKNMKKQKKILSIYYIHALVQRRKKHNRVTKYMRNKKLKLFLCQFYFTVDSFLLLTLSSLL